MDKQEGTSFWSSINGLLGLGATTAAAFKSADATKDAANANAKAAALAAQSSGNTTRMLLIGGAILAVVVVAFLALRGK